MLQNGTLQFTHATRLNDPFDCHPSLLDYSKVPESLARAWGKEFMEEVKYMEQNQNRNDTWVCSLSKVHDSLLMWSYYNSHKGICIGLDSDKVKECTHNLLNGVYFGPIWSDVQYKDVLEKPDYFHGHGGLYCYQLTTKAKAWEHEQEVRLLLQRPAFNTDPNVWCYPLMKLTSKCEPLEDGSIDYRDYRGYVQIEGECFSSVYLGINIAKSKRDKIIEIAKTKNPNIKFFQMNPDPTAFRLVAEEIK